MISDEKKQIILDKVNDCVNKYGCGLELVELRFSKEYGKMNITVFIWKKEGISLDDCEAFHNFIMPSFDEIDEMFTEDYVLNVSSSGLDRPIVSDDDFRRATDTVIEVIMNDKTKKHGKLVSYTDEELVISTDKGKELVINRKNITKVQPYISF